MAASIRGAFLFVRYLLQVVTALLHVRQELGESIPADDMSAAFWPLAIPHGGYAVQVGRDFYAAPVV